MKINGTPEQWNDAVDKVMGMPRNGWNGFQNGEIKEEPFATSNWCKKLPPPRQWFYSDHYIRGSLSCTIADGGTGKTSLALIEAIVMALGRALLGIAPIGRRRVLYWNGEEPRDEIERRVHAICQRYNIDPAELNGCLFVCSGLQHPINASDEHGLVNLEHSIDDNRIEIVILDPFISCHRAPENDNTALDVVAKRFAAFADLKKIGVEITHHVRKPAHSEADTFTVHDARGAVALTNAGRAIRVLNRMTENEAARAGVANRRAYVRVESGGKANYTAGGSVYWLQLASETLDNFDGVYGPDSVGVVTEWRFPGPFEGISQAHLDEVLERAAAGRYRADPQSPDWIGIVIADVLHLDPVKDVKRVKVILDGLIENRELKKVQLKDVKRRPRTFVVPRTFEVEDDCST